MQARLAGAARRRHRDLRREQRPGAFELRRLALQPLGPLVAEADADVVTEAVADGQLALRTDAAAKHEPREP